MKNISFVLFSFNEEKRIEYVLRNLLPYGEVYVFDGGSTDKTKEITEQLGGHFIVRPVISTVHVETQEMFLFVKSVIKTDWIFWSYVDNLLPKTLLEKMTEVANQDIYKYVYIPVDTYMWGETEYPVIRASYPNFFHKDFVDFTTNKMHGLGQFTGKKEQILNLPMKKELAIRHFSLYDLNKFITGHVRYAVPEAEDKMRSGKRFSVYYMLGSMANYFWLFYKRGWRAGVRGLYGAMLYSFFRLMVSVKLYELEHNLTLETIEAAFQKEKKNIVDEIERK